MSELNEQMIELTIEALTGTVYDLCVSPFETILGIKMKIQRLEGIPVYQQQLVHGNTELHDEFCLEEYSIGSGAQLKLLLAMRGGPIHAHRIQLEDPTLLEIAEALEGHDPDHKYTVMLLSDGDMVDMADFVEVVAADESPQHVSPLPRTTSAEQETTSAIALSKMTRTKMQDLMERLRNRKPPTMQIGVEDVSSGHSASRLQRRGAAKVLILDSRSSNRLLHSSAPSPITPHPRDIPTSTSNPSAVHRKLVFPVTEGQSGALVEETADHYPRQYKAAELQDGGEGPIAQRGQQLLRPTQHQSVPTPPPPPPHHPTDHYHHHHIPHSHRHQGRQWKRRRRLRRPSCVQEKASQHSHKDDTLGQKNLLREKCSVEVGASDNGEVSFVGVCELTEELSQLGISSEGDKTTSDPHLPPVCSMSTTVHPPKHAHFTAGSTAPRLPAIAAGHTPCLTGTGHGSKGRPHCGVCGKKTGLASTYTCRCGCVFCARHRYAESHDCSYDYKTQGREIIARGNPLVVASKLPKI